MTEKIVAKDTEHLKKLIKDAMRKNTFACDLNFIDVSNITDMRGLFSYSKFNGDISKWDVSNVDEMEGMFKGASSFNQPLENWDVSRVKTMNESIYYGIDAIHTAINNNNKIQFHYFRWNVKGEPEYGHDGDYYTVSPWALTWDNQNYYLIAYDSENKELRHYRVDKMKDISVLEEEKREGAKVFKEQNKDVYVVPGNIDSINSTGTNNLIKEGALVITSYEDLFN